MSVLSGTMTPGFATSTKIDLNQIGEARNSMLGIKLDQVRGKSCSCTSSCVFVFRAFASTTV